MLQSINCIDDLICLLLIHPLLAFHFAFLSQLGLAQLLLGRFFAALMLGRGSTRKSRILFLDIQYLLDLAPQTLVPGWNLRRLLMNGRGFMRAALVV